MRAINYFILKKSNLPLSKHADSNNSNISLKSHFYHTAQNPIIKTKKILKRDTRHTKEKLSEKTTNSEQKRHERQNTPIRNNNVNNNTPTIHLSDCDGRYCVLCCV